MFVVLVVQCPDLARGTVATSSCARPWRSSAHTAVTPCTVRRAATTIGGTAEAMTYTGHRLTLTNDDAWARWRLSHQA
jgi:hypothetical protein